MSKVRTSQRNNIAATGITRILHLLAANEALDTKKAIRTAIREAGLPGRDEYVEAVLNNREEHETQRKNRQKRRNIAHTGKAWPTRARKASQQPVVLPAGTPASRLVEYRRRQVEDVAFSLFRSGAAGGTTFTVKLTDAWENVGYTVSIGANWDTYRGRFKEWRANEDHHEVTLPVRWMTRILRSNLAELDGLMTLDACEIASGMPEVKLFKAIWARQGKGYSVITEHGFIARKGEMTHHADTAAKALAGLRRKLAQTGQPRRTIQSALDMDVAAFIKRYSRHDCMVSLNDARSSGSCEAGILNWCERVGIDPLRSAVPLSEALEAFSRYPLVEVRLAVMQAVRRHRREQRLAA